MPDSTEQATDPLTAALDEIRICLRSLAPLGSLGGRVTGDARYDGHLLALRDVYAPALAAAIDTVLGMHAQTAYTAWIEPCAKHLGDIPGRRGCPDCRPVQRMGCDRCRDGNGRPARPEDCRERQVIMGELLRKDR
ncbi:MAG TPA: hypothetical protein VKU39_06475 [Streptosporangiaceae bacterium]|nr:hypothetical protein [Streptosporangiaceae bacterium]